MSEISYLSANGAADADQKQALTGRKVNAGGECVGLAWLRIHTLKRWLAKEVSDGPQAVIGMPPDRAAKIATRRHADRIDRLQSKIDNLISEVTA